MTEFAKNKQITVQEAFKRIARYGQQMHNENRDHALREDD